MKRIVSLILLAAMLVPLAALAAPLDFQALNDEEIQAVIDGANQELARRLVARTDYLATGSVAGFFVGIRSISRAEDFEGRPAFTLAYDLRNDSQAPQSPLLLLAVAASQNGVPNEVTFVLKPGEGIESPNLGEVGPGEMISEATDYLINGEGLVTVTVSLLIPDGTSTPFVAELPLP
ncbi:MAG: hypothetical protein PHP02_01405 [Eubacteriales bacterium]|nr:hypothetical protein [Eubacteriales bacterium]